VNDGGGGLWVFGYGSLMWDPGFRHVEAHPARIHGYHRALCVFSSRYRGTEERPGLVLGLDRGGSCVGRVYRIDATDTEKARGDLWEREMSSNAYRPTTVTAALAGGGSVRALTFVARRDHVQYTSRLDLDEAARLVRRGCGARGTALDYLRNVVSHLDDVGIIDGPLHRVLAIAERLDDEPTVDVAS